MSYKPPYQGPQTFKQTLTYEDIVKEQIKKTTTTGSLNDLPATAANVRWLMNLITPKMADTAYLEQMQELDDDWKKSQRRKQREFQKRRREAEGGCPDLVKKPSSLPDQQYWEDAFGICVALFERKGLLMKFETVDPLG